MRILALLLLSVALPLAAPAEYCPELHTFLQGIDNVSNWTVLASQLDNVGFITPLLSPAATFFVPTDAAVQKLQQSFGPQAGSGTDIHNITAYEVDRLLSLFFYHVIQNANTPDQLAAASSADTALDVFTGGGQMLSFSQSNSQVMVEGGVTGNSAPVPAKATAYCTSDVYVIDTVLLPSDQLSDIPAFSDILASLAAAPGPGPGPSASAEPAFTLALAPGPPATLTITGPSDKAGTAAAIAAAANAPAPATAASAVAPSPSGARSGYTSYRAGIALLLLASAVIFLSYS